VSAAAPLVITDLTVRRAVKTVLKGVSLEVPRGQVTTLLGPNGAGKSSLVLTLGGVLPAASGTVRVGDVDLLGRRPDEIRAEGLAVVPEGRRLLPHLSVQDNLRIAVYSAPRKQATAWVDEVLDLFPELRPKLDREARLLSGGEQQMVVLAQALASRPAFLVIDELSLGLAPVIVKRLMPTLTAVAASGVGILLIEQFAHVALALADDAYVLQQGEIVYRGTADYLSAHPESLHSSYLGGGAA
jgi:branched-chain amino acid transport system ATP-binding protein